MDRIQFLARVVAPGTFSVLCFKGVGQSHMGQRFFPRGDLAGADGFATWCVNRQMDVWHAVAAYRNARQDGVDNRGNPKYKGKRDQTNVELLTCLWHDADISRPGDGKAPGKTWADLSEVVNWTNDLYRNCGLLVPNLWVRSGYGVHLYWVFDTPLDQPSWQPQAEALRNLMVANGGRGDMGLTTDSARILRPPGTKNFKVAGSPQPVEVIDAWTTAPYPNLAFFKALQPYVGAAPAAAAAAGPVNNTLPSGAPAGAYQGRASAAAAAGKPVPVIERGHTAENIYTNGCLQLRRSRDTHGAQDAYNLWYLGWMSLAVFLDDRADFVHEVSDAHPTYVRANVDAMLAQAQTERQNKGTGPPLCATLNAARTGVCDSCPHWGRIKSPLSLGTLDYDLPAGYRRGQNRIERAHYVKGELEWTWLVKGNLWSGSFVYEPFTEKHYIIFTYQFDANHAPKQVMLPADGIPGDGRCINYFMGFTINLIDNPQANAFRKFIMAWIDKLRDQTHVQTYAKPFGWNRDKADKIIGFAVCDTLYKVDGTTAPISTADPHTRKNYRVVGDPQKWTDACNFVTKGRPELQVMVAAAFAAPLLELVGSDTKGLAFSLWSEQSGTGKSSAIIAGTTAWGSIQTIHRYNDTANAATTAMTQVQSLPNYWDELPPTDEALAKIADTLFMLSPGRGKARASYGPEGIRVVDPGEWCTIMSIANNQPLVDYIEKSHPHTNAAVLRLFEICCDLPQPVPTVSDAGQIVGSLHENRGHVGRTYAAWIAQHVDIIRQDALGLQAEITADFGTTTDERFYVTFITCILLAAAYADGELGLAQFDYDEIYDLLKRELLAKRKGRKDEAPVRDLNNPIDLLGKFMDQYRPSLVVLDEFRGPTNPRRDPQIIYPPYDPRAKGFAAVHAISYHDHLLRINEDALRDFCRKNKRSYEPLRKGLLGLGATRRDKAPIASGTTYSSAARRAWDIPLDQDPDLAQFLVDQIPQDALTAYLKLLNRPSSKKP